MNALRSLYDSGNCRFALTQCAAQPYAVETMKMFCRKKGDLIDVIGNSNHPNARFNYYDTRRPGDSTGLRSFGFGKFRYGVAEVGLPRSSFNITSRTTILEDNSIKKVLTREMTNYVVAAYASVGITLQPDEIAMYITPYLKNADAPGYFTQMVL